MMYIYILLSQPIIRVPMRNMVRELGYMYVFNCFYICLRLCLVVEGCLSSSSTHQVVLDLAYACLPTPRWTLQRLRNKNTSRSCTDLNLADVDFLQVTDQVRLNIKFKFEIIDNDECSIGNVSTAISVDRRNPANHLGCKQPYGNKPYQLVQDCRHAITIWTNQKEFTLPDKFRILKHISPKIFGKIIRSN